MSSDRILNSECLSALDCEQDKYVTPKQSGQSHMHHVLGYDTDVACVNKTSHATEKTIGKQKGPCQSDAADLEKTGDKSMVTQTASLQIEPRFLWVTGVTCSLVLTDRAHSFLPIADRTDWQKVNCMAGVKNGNPNLIVEIDKGNEMDSDMDVGVLYCSVLTYKQDFEVGAEEGMHLSCEWVTGKKLLVMRAIKQASLVAAEATDTAVVARSG